jgi:hypothetical protein
MGQVFSTEAILGAFTSTEAPLFPMSAAAVPRAGPMDSDETALIQTRR